MWGFDFGDFIIEEKGRYKSVIDVKKFWRSCFSVGEERLKKVGKRWGVFFWVCFSRDSEGYVG